MGLNYFANTAGDSTKSPLEPKVHFTFSSSNVTYASDLLNEESFWKEYGSVLTTIAFNHFVSFAACANLFWFSLLWIGLTTRQLVSFYTYMMAFACVPLSFLANCYTMNLLHTDVRINNYLDTPTYFPLFNILRRFLVHTIRKVKLMSKNSNLTKPQLFHEFFTQFFLTIFLVKSKLSTAKKSKTTTFSRVFLPKKWTIFSGNQS